MDANGDSDGSDGHFIEVNEEEVMVKVPEAIEAIKRKYKAWRRSYRDVDSWLVQEMFLNSMSKMYDPHSSFLSRDSYEEFTIHIKNSLIGIGVGLRDENGVCVITNVMPGGPAKLSGQINSGDKIVAVAQGDDGEFVDIIGMRLYKTVKLLRGQKGTVVRIKLETVNGDTKIVSLVRDSVKMDEARASGKYFELKGNNGIVRLGVIELPSFYGDIGSDDSDGVSADEDVAELVKILKNKNIDGLILDLRQNGGGLLNQAVSIAGLFVKTGPVVQIKDTFGKIERLSDEDDRVLWKGPLAVLSSPMSASASEILIGALHDHKRALIVGAEATYGKGSVQVALDMNMFKTLRNKDKDMGAAYVTVQKWYLPTGDSTQLKGVSADIKLKNLESCLNKREASYPHALRWDSIPAVEFDFDEEIKSSKDICFIDEELVNHLNELSQKRQSVMPEFELLNERIKHFDKVVNKNECYLQIFKRLEEKREKDLFLKEVNNRITALEKECGFLSEEVELPDIKHDEDEKPSKEKEDIDGANVFDVNLRECLRILRDWVDILHTVKAPMKEANSLEICE